MTIQYMQCALRAIRPTRWCQQWLWIWQIHFHFVSGTLRNGRSYGVPSSRGHVDGTAGASEPLLMYVGCQFVSSKHGYNEYILYSLAMVLHQSGTKFRQLHNVFEIALSNKLLRALSDGTWCQQSKMAAPKQQIQLSNRNLEIQDGGLQTGNVYITATRLDSQATPSNGYAYVFYVYYVRRTNGVS